MKTTKILATGLISGALAFVSCTPTQQQYGLGGAAAGAAAGALLGGDGSDIAKGAALGAAGGTGYAIYKEKQENRNTSAIAPPPPAPVDTDNFPKAFTTDTPGIVISPYKPYDKVNVKNFRPGDLAKDPTTGKVFVVPR